MSAPTPVADAARHSRDVRLQRLYGLTLEEWERVLAAQGGGCAGCGRQGVTRSLHTDHSHRTRITRGILCPACNSGLRKYGDDPVRLRAMADYLEDPPAVRLLGERLAAPVKRRRKARLKRKAKARKRRAPR